MYNKQHLTAILWYIGIWFIGGSISHGFFSGTRSVIMAIVWILLFIISEYLKEGQKDYMHLILWWLIYSIAVGMVNGWFQHFLDSPMRSLWIVPVWWLISTAIFPYKESLSHYDIKKSLWVWLIISLCLGFTLYAMIYILPADVFGTWGHNENVATLDSQKTIWWTSTTTQSPTVSDHH